MPLVYAGVSRRERHDRAMELLGRVGLMDRADIGLPSCREARSSVAVARALVNDPSLILADEPTGNLDSRSGAQILISC